MLDVVKTQSGHEVAYVGPSLNQGPLPAFFYFSLSAHDSLTLDPYNQPVAFLHNDYCRIFSMTIPGHEKGLDKMQAMAYWAEHFAKGEDILTPFINNCAEAIKDLIADGYLQSEKIAVGGLSRGGFIATHVAAKVEAVSHVLGYAPLTRLNYLEDFSGQPNYLNLETIAKELIHKRIRYYIGNRDLRVGTHHCFDWVSHLVETAYQKGVRSPQIELIISPSIGLKGHGTSPQTFREGINWLLPTFE